MRRRADVVSLLVILGVALSCGTFRSASRAAPSRRELAVDTTVVIIRVFNYQPAEVTVYLDTQLNRQRVGVVTSMHEAFFVLPSAEVMTIDAFFLTVISASDGVKPYSTGMINRNRNKITMVYVAVGEDVSKSGSFRENAPSS
jgi:hypothetical protein